MLELDFLKKLTVVSPSSGIVVVSKRWSAMNTHATYWAARRRRFRGSWSLTRAQSRAKPKGFNDFGVMKTKVLLFM